MITLPTPNINKKDSYATYNFPKKDNIEQIVDR